MEKHVKSVPCEYHIRGLWRTLNILYIKLSRKRFFTQHLFPQFLYAGNILGVFGEDNECVCWDCLGLAGIANAFPGCHRSYNSFWQQIICNTSFLQCKTIGLEIDIYIYIHICKYQYCKRIWGEST